VLTTSPTFQRLAFIIVLHFARGKHAFHQQGARACLPPVARGTHDAEQHKQSLFPNPSVRDKIEASYYLALVAILHKSSSSAAAA
jgi:hypothetical protein